MAGFRYKLSMGAVIQNMQNLGARGGARINLDDVGS